jgi:Ca2+-binding RTX toxin-like protein
MKVRAALTAALVTPSLLALTGPVAPTYAAASVCQGRAATIEGASGTLTGTEGDDVIVGTGPTVSVEALGGNDLVCVVGGHVSTGPGDDSVLATPAYGVYTEASLFGGRDSFISVGEAGAEVYVDEVSELYVDIGGGTGVVWLLPTSTPGTGSVSLGPLGGRIYALGETEAHVDLVHHTAGVDGLLDVSIANVRSATGTGTKVRLTGDDRRNDLDGYGCDVVLDGNDGRDTMAKVGNGFDLDLPDCHRYRSVLKGGDGPDRLTGRNGNDVMLGGRGRDVADGSGGDDRCVVEVARHCER